MFYISNIKSICGVVKYESLNMIQHLEISSTSGVVIKDFKIYNNEDRRFLKMFLDKLRPYGYGKGYVFSLDKYDIKLLSFLSKPKLCILKGERGTFAYVDKALYLNGTLLDYIKIDNQYNKNKIVDIIGSSLYIGVCHLPFNLSICHKYSINNINKFNSFLSKLVLVGKIKG